MTELKLLRGDIIERTANLESLIAGVLSQHYFGRGRQDFIFDFLFDEYCTFALKRRILLKVAPDLKKVQGFEQSLNRLNTIRNYFAHVGALISDGPAPNALNRTPHPENFEKSVDFEALHQEFLAKEKPVVEALFQLYRQLGGTFAHGA